MTSIQEGSNGFDPLHLLNDKDLWLKIIARLDDPKDLHSLCNTCTTFQKLLGEDRWDWGFNLILPHITPYLSRNNDDISPHLSLRLADQNWTGLLKIRECSKSWGKAIDDFLISPCDLGKSGERKHRLVHNFSTTQAIQQFQERFANWGKNPFPGRAIDLSSTNWALENFLDFLNNPQNADEERLMPWTRYIRKNFELIKEFGEHIHCLILGPDCISGSCRESYETIRNLLLNLPNIRSLTLPSNLQPFSEVERERIINYMSENPLPELPHLEVINLNPHCVEIYGSILAYYAPQLKQVNSLPLSNATARALIENMQRLEKLALFLDLNDPRNSEYFSQLPSTLKALNVSLGNINGDESQEFHIDSFLQAIRHIPLDALCVAILDRTIIKESGLELDEYKNESIKVFTFVYCASSMTVSFNFLEALSKAEDIEISHISITPGVTTQRQYPPGIQETIQIYPYFYRRNLVFEGDPYTKMYESNIWDILPSLKTLHVHGVDRFHPGLNEGDAEGNELEVDSFQAHYSRIAYDRWRIQNAH